MKKLCALTPEKLARAEARLRHPAPGSRIEAAQRFGIDLTLLMSTLRRTPAERARHMHDMCQAAERYRGAARKKQR
ncbi:MAG TPA: hypothetical protein VMT86_00360 [Bryobacteraceae bacterium]|nr:hypothetical protein [Bryobacteraceae bacterium]